MKRTQNPLNKARAAGAAMVPGAKEQNEMKRKFGFTLVELLVVIAIISILAAIVTPRVQGYILRGRMTKAVSEVHGIELAMAKVLTDAGKDNFKQLFQEPNPAVPGGMFSPPADEAELKSQIDTYTDAFYNILRQGRGATLPTGLAFAEGVQSKLGTSYLDLGLDSWDRKYMFWVGPWKGYDDTDTEIEPIPFRIYHAGEESEDGTSYTVFKYTEDNRNYLNGLIPGYPPYEDPALPGIPAPTDLGIYVFSTGVNMQIDQYFNDKEVPGGNTAMEDVYRGGGDDINNWDKEQNWTGFYS